MIAILEPGKHLDDPTSYRPISLLCCCYKLLERLLLTRLAPIFESVIPPEQAGFRKKRNTCDQVLALTSYIESGFQNKLNTGVALIDLSGMTLSGKPRLDLTTFIFYLRKNYKLLA